MSEATIKHAAETPTPANWRATLKLIRRFLPFAYPYRNALIFASLLIVVRVATDLVQPWPFKVVIDNVLRNRPLRLSGFPQLSHWLGGLQRWDLLIVCAGFMIARTILDAIFTYLSSVRMTRISEWITCDIRCALYGQMQRQSLLFFDRYRTGDLVTRFTGDSSNIEDMLVAVVSVSLVNGLTILSTVILMFMLDVQLTMIAFTVLPFLFLVNRYFTKRIRAASRERRRKEGEIASLVQENISLIRVIQSFAREDFEGERFGHSARSALSFGLLSTRLQSQFSPISTFITGLGTTLVIILGARGVLLGRVSLGTLIVLLTYLRSLYGPVKQLSRLVNTVAKATVSAERVAEVLDSVPEVQDAPGAIAAPKLIGRICFENVDFAYPRRGLTTLGPPVLADFSLEIPAGSTVALVGHTGAGKTTIANLISRFYAPTRGRILIDGYDLRDLQVDSLRQQISVVPQEAVLFRATIWENIAYGLNRHEFRLPPVADPSNRPPAEIMQRIIDAAMAANAHEFIARLPDTYRTVIGERGSSLSGGQRQRIAIARAMIRDAPILILDEPTTGLDAKSEDLVLEAIERLKRNRTTLIIAHRLATIRSSDLIVVLENGCIAEVGTHEALYDGHGRYRDFYDRQFQMHLAGA
jgi:ABC-type multidrug transport system fused ATPase/permease subunit